MAMLVMPILELSADCSKGLSINDVRNQEEEGFVHYEQGAKGFFSADVRTFWFKIFGFFEIYSVSARTRRVGVEPVRTFCRQGGRGLNFSRFCVDVF